MALPQSLCDRMELLARVHPLVTVASIVGVDRITVGIVKRRGWKAVPPGRNRRPMPTDFAIYSRKETRDQLCARYRCSPQAIQRWRKELEGRG